MMINFISIIACFFTMIGSYLVACGHLKPAYMLGLINGSLYTFLNISISLRGDELSGVSLLAIPSAWGVAMAIKGLLRLRVD